MTYRSEARDMRMVLVGDVMLSRRLTPYDEPGHKALRELIQGAHVAFANLETVVRAPDEGVPNFTQGTPMSTPPRLLDDLDWMGFNLLGCANNHATDYGVDGVRASIGHLRRAGFAFAGIGANLAEARMPAYLDTAAGRVGMTAATSFFRVWNKAAQQRPDTIGRPGINPLGFTTRYTVDEEALAALRRISDALGLTQERARHRTMFYSAKEAPPEADTAINFLGGQFEQGAGFAVSTTVSRKDAEANLRWIREARRQADWVVFSFHFHEFGDNGRLTAATDTERGDPAAFVTDFAREAIDAGADVVAGHGPHVTLGVEVYKDRPILYSLGNFVFQNDTVERFPAEAYERFDLDGEAMPGDFLDARTGNGTRGFPASPEYWEGIAASCDFTGGKLSAVTLHPLDLGFGRGRAERGRPLLAEGETAERILARVGQLSRQHGTDMRIDGEVGRVAF